MVHWDSEGVPHDHRLHLPVATSVAEVEALMVQYALDLPRQLTVNEKQDIKDKVREGVDPATLVSVWINARQRARMILSGMMTMEAEDAILASEYINTLTDMQIDNAFGVAKRKRIRTRITGLLALKAGLDADAAKREEL